MSHKSEVCSYYEHAMAEQESTGEWSVWNVCYEIHCPSNTRMIVTRHKVALLGARGTEDEAWKEAAQTVRSFKGNYNNEKV